MSNFNSTNELFTDGQPYPQGFNSPQRSPMVPQGMPPHQVYQYQGQHRGKNDVCFYTLTFMNRPFNVMYTGGPMMMRYPPDMVSPNISPAPVMMPPGQPHSTPPVMSGPIPPRPSGMDGGGRSPYTSPQNVTPSLSPQPSNPESSPRT
jgi:hypothetical protein